MKNATLDSYTTKQFTAASIDTTHSTDKRWINENLIFNLNGQRCSQPAKGINIIGGRKVII